MQVEKASQYAKSKKKTMSSNSQVVNDSSPPSEHNEHNSSIDDEKWPNMLEKDVENNIVLLGNETMLYRGHYRYVYVKLVEYGGWYKYMRACYGSASASNLILPLIIIDLYTFFSLREGEWNGFGILYSKVGFYGGEFRGGSPCGQGTLHRSNGDVLQGEWGVVSRFEDPEASSNPYLTSMARVHRKVDVSFSDGARYTGMMEGGRITGRGRYVNAIGSFDFSQHLSDLLRLLYI